VSEPLGIVRCCRMPTDQGFARQNETMQATASPTPTKHIRGLRNHNGASWSQCNRALNSNGSLSKPDVRAAEDH